MLNLQVSYYGLIILVLSGTARHSILSGSAGVFRSPQELRSLGSRLPEKARQEDTRGALESETKGRFEQTDMRIKAKICSLVTMLPSTGLHCLLLLLQAAERAFRPAGLLGG